MRCTTSWLGGTLKLSPGAMRTVRSGSSSTSRTGIVPVVLVRGQARERGSDVELNADEVKRMPRPSDRSPSRITIRVPSGLAFRKLELLKDALIEASTAGTVPVHLLLELPDRTVRIAPGDNFKVPESHEVVQRIETILGHRCVVRQFDGRPAPL